MGLCVLTAGKTLAYAVTAFTLSWTHSVEKTRWEEHWRVESDGLKVVEGRIEGSGAGMDPPPDAVFRDGWYIYHPHVPALKAVHLAASGATVGGWELCTDGRCMTIGEKAGGTITLKPCEAESK